MEIDVPYLENPIKTDKKVKNTLAPRKKKMIEALTAELGIVTSACRIVGIHPDTHYEWLKKDPVYKSAVEALDTRKDDIIEKAFLSLVIDKNPQAVIHAVKTKLRHRGYGDEMTVTNNYTEGFKLIIEDGSKMETKSEAKNSV